MQSSGSGGSDGSAHDEGPRSEVSFTPSHKAVLDETFLSMFFPCRSGHQCEDCKLNFGRHPEPFCVVRVLVRELEEHYQTAKTDMMLAARTKPIHGESSDPHLSGIILRQYVSVCLNHLAFIYFRCPLCPAEMFAGGTKPTL